VIVILAGVIASGVFAWTLVSEGSSDDGPKTAVIVDQLNLTWPNQEFVDSTTALLEGDDYSVDYFSGEEITVDFYRTLPNHGYDLIVLRAHAGLYSADGSEAVESPDDAFLALFTNEPYDQYTYFDEQNSGRIGKAFYHEGGEELFAVGPEFVSSSMQGEFDDAVIVMMGCDGLGTARTAEEFIRRGAKSFISWSKPVSAKHTDKATGRLLEKLFVDHLPTADAVDQTATEVGPDPSHGAELRFLGSGD
jgi:hypothetical protein